MKQVWNGEKDTFSCILLLEKGGWVQLAGLYLSLKKHRIGLKLTHKKGKLIEVRGRFMALSVGPEAFIPRNTFITKNAFCGTMPFH